MRGQWSLTQETLLKWFLATVLLSAGIITGMRFAENSNSAVEPSFILEEAPRIDISGEWIGTTTEDYGMEARYDYRVVFEQDGNSLTGILYLTMSNYEPAIYSETRLSGRVQGETILYWAEEILVLENAQPDQMCLAQTTVTFETVENQDILVGTWEGQPNQQFGCDSISGHTMLTRQPE